AISAMSPNSLVSSRRPVAGISAQAIAPRACLASEAAWELSIGVGASMLRPIADQFADFHPLLRVRETRRPKAPDEEMNPLRSSARRVQRQLGPCRFESARTHEQVR